MTRQTHFVRSPSGILIPVGETMGGSTYSKKNFAHIKERAKNIRHLFAESGEPLAPTSSLARLASRAEKLSDDWLTNNLTSQSNVDAFYALHVDRIADALLPLISEPKRRRYLRTLRGGTLDFFDRRHSAAKDVLWELELWSMLLRAGAPAQLRDPPDIVFSSSRGELGIACKKVYSEASVENNLRTAVKQVAAYRAGVAAFNIDELIPPGQVFAGTEDDATAKAHELVDGFLQRHENLFRRYLAVGRLVAVWVSVCFVTDIRNGNTAFNNFRQSTAWHIPALDEEKTGLVGEFMDAVRGSRNPRLGKE